jgi:hypothetical protein
MKIFCKKVILGQNSEEILSSPKDDDLDEMKEAILLALSDEPIFSVRQLVCMICVPKGCTNCISSACRLSTFRSQIHGVSHELADTQKSGPVKLSIQLRDLLLSIRHQGQDGDIYEPLTIHGSPCRQIMR